jgi:hypothetical protein
MHQDATHGMKTETTFLIPYASDPVSDSNLVWAFPAETKNSVVSCNTKMGPWVAMNRSFVARICPARMSASFTRSFEKKRYAALVFAQSWQAIGMPSPTASLIYSDKQ